jgi:hypothetical protein
MYRELIERAFPWLDETIRLKPNEAEASFKRASAYRLFRHAPARSGAGRL